MGDAGLSDGDPSGRTWSLSSVHSQYKKRMEEQERVRSAECGLENFSRPELLAPSWEESRPLNQKYAAVSLSNVGMNPRSEHPSLRVLGAFSDINQARRFAEAVPESLGDVWLVETGKAEVVASSTQRMLEHAASKNRVRDAIINRYLRDRATSVQDFEKLLHAKTNCSDVLSVQRPQLGCTWLVEYCKFLKGKRPPAAMSDTTKPLSAANETCSQDEPGSQGELGAAREPPTASTANAASSPTCSRACTNDATSTCAQSKTGEARSGHQPGLALARECPVGEAGGAGPGQIQSLPNPVGESGASDGNPAHGERGTFEMDSGSWPVNLRTGNQAYAVVHMLPDISEERLYHGKPAEPYFVVYGCFPNSKSAVRWMQEKGHASFPSVSLDVVRMYVAIPIEKTFQDTCQSLFLSGARNSDCSSEQKESEDNLFFEPGVIQGTGDTLYNRKNEHVQKIVDYHFGSGQETVRRAVKEIESIARTKENGKNYTVPVRCIGDVPEPEKPLSCTIEETAQTQQLSLNI